MPMSDSKGLLSSMFLLRFLRASLKVSRQLKRVNLAYLPLICCSTLGTTVDLLQAISSCMYCSSLLRCCCTWCGGGVAVSASAISASIMSILLHCQLLSLRLFTPLGRNRTTVEALQRLDEVLGLLGLGLYLPGGVGRLVVDHLCRQLALVVVEALAEVGEVLGLLGPLEEDSGHPVVETVGPDAHLHVSHLPEVRPQSRHFLLRHLEVQVLYLDCVLGPELLLFELLLPYGRHEGFEDDPVAGLLGDDEFLVVLVDVLLADCLRHEIQHDLAGVEAHLVLDYVHALDVAAGGVDVRVDRVLAPLRREVVAVGRALVPCCDFALSFFDDSEGPAETAAECSQPHHNYKAPTMQQQVQPVNPVSTKNIKRGFIRRRDAPRTQPALFCRKAIAVKENSYISKSVVGSSSKAASSVCAQSEQLSGSKRREVAHRSAESIRLHLFHIELSQKIQKAEQKLKASSPKDDLTTVESQDFRNCSAEKTDRLRELRLKLGEIRVGLPRVR